MRARQLPVARHCSWLLNILPAARAAAPAAAEIEINHLLGLIEQSGCEFFRNGTWYDAQRAQAHLRAKYDMLAASDQIKTAEDFIEKAASRSSHERSTLPNKVRRRAAMTTSQWFDAALARYRTTSAAAFLAHRALRAVRKDPARLHHFNSSIIHSDRQIVMDRLHMFRVTRKGNRLVDGLLASRGTRSHTTPFLSVST